ncbi:MAG: DUF4011 domain-containing protein, partial [Nitrospirota bacterium]
MPGGEHLGTDAEAEELKGKRPPAKEYAPTVGINPSYDLPEPGGESNPHHGDKYIQTLHYPDELESLLRLISAAARTAIEESGTNMLFMVFGFLEWYESDDSDKPLFAPLLMVPLSLLRHNPQGDTSTYEYSAEYSHDDLMSNLSLVERLQRDFGICVPHLSEHETPETYISKLTGIVQDKPRWRIRRQVSVTMLNFGKLLMFLDLDPKRWPSSHQILEHPRVREILEGSSQVGNEPTYSDVYDLDNPANASIVPALIYDADSSQHSALFDAVNGRNLVIEGPPGTGKSQTITNLIAAALVHGKSVLFVAEKLAALEVVRNRLDKAGLGHFCLELHSHKTHKNGVLADVDMRIKAQRNFKDPATLDYKLRLLEENKQKLIK